MLRLFGMFRVSFSNANHLKSVESSLRLKLLYVAKSEGRAFNCKYALFIQNLFLWINLLLFVPLNFQDSGPYPEKSSAIIWVNKINTFHYQAFTFNIVARIFPSSLVVHFADLCPNSYFTEKRMVSSFFYIIIICWSWKSYVNRIKSVYARIVFREEKNDAIHYL